MANLVLLTADLWLPAEDFVAVVAQGLTPFAGNADTERLDLKQLAILKIDARRFAEPTAYQGTSPLDRCTLARDLAIILNRPEILTLAVDLDLSPTERGAGKAVDEQSGGSGNGARPTGEPNKVYSGEVERNCQLRLDQLIDMHAQRLVLMAPLTSAHPPTEERIQHWKKERQKKPVTFGNAELSVSRGIMRERVQPADNQPAFGNAIREHILRVGFKAGSPAEPAGKPLAEATAAPSAHRSPIAFHSLRAFYANGAAMAVDDDCFVDPRRQCQITAVIFGAGYSGDDQYETPLALMHGVDVHAAIAACQAPTAGEQLRGHLLAYAIEVLIGILLFGPLLGYFWGRFYATVAARHPSAAESGARVNSGWRRLPSMIRAALIPNRPGAAYLWLIYLFAAVLLLFLMLVVFIPVAWTWAFPSTCHVRLMPIAFVIGMIIEAGFVQNVEAATHEVGTSRRSCDDSSDCRLSTKAGFDPQSCFLWFLYAAVFIAAMGTLIHH